MKHVDVVLVIQSKQGELICRGHSDVIFPNVNVLILFNLHYIL